ncbi:MAG TPA: hypothetical protein VFO34_09395 [Candidatus Acidoferrales bacterium]|nr:hypothetical protein [Candidatus Acidoferrales bacterium]
MTFHSRAMRAVPALLLAFGCVAGASAQSLDPAKPAASQKGFTWIESYEGSGDSSGWISDVNSTAGYNFGEHFGVYFGVPYYLFHPSTTKTGLTAASGLGNPYLGFNVSKKSSLVNFSTGINASAPISSSKKDGLSTGRVTFDWSNHFDHDFGWVKPFATFGVANSVPDTRYFFRPFTSLGKLAHFEIGPEFDLGDKFSVTISGYAITPWGTQKTFERGNSGPGGGEKTGTASLTRDNGMNLGFDYNLTRTIDAYAGYSRSTALSANTFSVGVSFNIAEALKPRVR